MGRWGEFMRVRYRESLSVCVSVYLCVKEKRIISKTLKDWFMSSILFISFVFERWGEYICV